MAVQDVIDQLKSIDIEQLRAKALEEIRSGKKTRRQQGVKILRAVEGLKRSGLEPQDLAISKVPVIPPGFRPYSTVGETFVPGDANELYSDLFRAKEVYRDSVNELGEEDSRELKSYLDNAVRAVYGYGDSPNPKLKSRGISGFNKKITGTNAKNSWVQGKMLSKPQDFVGRAVISPDPSLSMDEVSIPEDMGWELADNHIQRRLAAQGIPKARALQMIRERQPAARAALDAEIRERPFIYSRAPAWHKQNTISGWVKLNKGKNIGISPLVTTGLGADFDGDTASVHVPITEEETNDAKNKLLPSKMAFSIRDRDKILPAPKHEMLLGIYSGQMNPSGKIVEVENEQEALSRFDSGELKADDQVIFKNKKI